MQKECRRDRRGQKDRKSAEELQKVQKALFREPCRVRSAAHGTLPPPPCNPPGLPPACRPVAWP